jgi:hypothetical protein
LHVLPSQRVLQRSSDVDELQRRLWGLDDREKGGRHQPTSKLGIILRVNGLYANFLRALWLVGVD